MRFAVVIGMLLAAAGLACVGAIPRMPLRDVPVEVRESAEKMFPDVEWLDAVKLPGLTWKLVGKDRNGNHVEFFAYHNGTDAFVVKWSSGYVEIPLANVPEEVIAALKWNMPGFVPSMVLKPVLKPGRDQIEDPRLIVGKFSPSIYRFRGKDFRGKNVLVEVVSLPYWMHGYDVRQIQE
jgi:hypothetical protein